MDAPRAGGRSDVSIPMEIKATSSLAPGAKLSTAEVAARMTEDRDVEGLLAATGISTRYHVQDAVGVTTELGARLLRIVLAAAHLDPSELARLIFVTSHGGDRLIPATATRILERFGLETAADAFDLNNACMGFMTALDLAGRSVATGLGPVAIVVAEVLSQYLTPEDARPYAVLGDGLAAAIVGPPSRPGMGVLSTSLRTMPAVTGASLEHPGLTGRRETIRFTHSNQTLRQLALAGIRERTAEVLEGANLEIEQIDWFVPHQPNGRLYEEFRKAVGVPTERTVPIVEDVGSIGAASIPMSLDRLFRTRDVKPGDIVLLAGVGAGGSTGATILRV